MKKNNTNKIKTDEQIEIKRFLLVLLGLIVIIIGIYFFTRAFVTKDLFKETSEINYTEGNVNYNVAIVGTMLNRPFKEYYVIAFSSEDNQATYYNTLVSKYMNEEKALKVYYLDLENELNKDYVATDDNYSKKFTSIKDLKLGSFTLIKVKNGKVDAFLTNEEDIKKELTVSKNK